MTAGGPHHRACLAYDWSVADTGASGDGVTPLWHEIVWRRPTDILARDDSIPPGSKARVFTGPVAPDDIMQGELGDCYLLSALSVLAEREDAVEQLFVKGKESDKHGVYVVRLCIQGHWRSIILDEQLPCFPDSQSRGRPIFSRGKGPELYVMLIEKAWAKAHGSYQAIVSGLPGECLTNLTGAPCKFIPHNEPLMWEKVYEATTDDPKFKSRGWFVVALLPDDPEYNLEDLGLVPGHAYGVLDARQLTLGDGQHVQLLQLRNPWGDFEWKGAYGPGTPQWTQEARAQMAGAQVDEAHDGCFWMTTQDFSKYFAGVQICRDSPGWHHTSEDIHMRAGQVSVLCLTVHGDTPVTLDVCMHQADRRMHLTKTDYNDEAFEYLGVRILVLHAETAEVVEHWPLTQQRDVWCEVKHLEPGQYWVLVETDWDGSERPDAKLNKKGELTVTLGACTLSDGKVELLSPSHCPYIDGSLIKETAIRYMCNAACTAADTLTYDLLFPPAARHAGKISKVRVRALAFMRALLDLMHCNLRRDRRTTPCAMSLRSFTRTTRTSCASRSACRSSCRMCASRVSRPARPK